MSTGDIRGDKLDYLKQFVSPSISKGLEKKTGLAKGGQVVKNLVKMVAAKFHRLSEKIHSGVWINNAEVQRRLEFCVKSLQKSADYVLHKQAEPRTIQNTFDLDSAKRDVAAIERLLLNMRGASFKPEKGSTPLDLHLIQLKSTFERIEAKIKALPTKTSVPRVRFQTEPGSQLTQQVISKITPTVVNELEERAQELAQRVKRGGGETVDRTTQVATTVKQESQLEAAAKKQTELQSEALKVIPDLIKESSESEEEEAAVQLAELANQLCDTVENQLEHTPSVAVAEMLPGTASDLIASSNESNKKLEDLLESAKKLTHLTKGRARKPVKGEAVGAKHEVKAEVEKKEILAAEAEEKFPVQVAEVIEVVEGYNKPNFERIKECEELLKKLESHSLKPHFDLEKNELSKIREALQDLTVKGNRGRFLTDNVPLGELNLKQLKQHLSAAQKAGGNAMSRLEEMKGDLEEILTTMNEYDGVVKELQKEMRSLNAPVKEGEGARKAQTLLAHELAEAFKREERQLKDNIDDAKSGTYLFWFQAELNNSKMTLEDKLAEIRSRRAQESLVTQLADLKDGTPQAKKVTKQLVEEIRVELAAFKEMIKGARGHLTQKIGEKLKVDTRISLGELKNAMSMVEKLIEEHENPKLLEMSSVDLGKYHKGIQEKLRPIQDKMARRFAVVATIEGAHKQFVSNLARLDEKIASEKEKIAKGEGNYLVLRRLEDVKRSLKGREAEYVKKLQTGTMRGDTVGKYEGLMNELNEDYVKSEGNISIRSGMSLIEQLIDDETRQQYLTDKDRKVMGEAIAEDLKAKVDHDLELLEAHKTPLGFKYEKRGRAGEALFTEAARKAVIASFNANAKKLRELSIPPRSVGEMTGSELKSWADKVSEEMQSNRRLVASFDLRQTVNCINDFTTVQEKVEREIARLTTMVPPQVKAYDQLAKALEAQRTKLAKMQDKMATPKAFALFRDEVNKSRKELESLLGNVKIEGLEEQLVHLKQGSEEYRYVLGELVGAEIRKIDECEHRLDEFLVKLESLNQSSELVDSIKKVFDQQKEELEGVKAEHTEWIQIPQVGAAPERHALEDLTEQQFADYKKEVADVLRKAEQALEKKLKSHPGLLLEYTKLKRIAESSLDV